VDASKKAIGWGGENQALSGSKVRRSADLRDAMKFIREKNAAVAATKHPHRSAKFVVAERRGLQSSIICRQARHLREILARKRSLVLTAYSIRRASIPSRLKRETMRGKGGIVNRQL